MVGSNGDGELCKGIVCFMIVQLNKFISYVIKSSPEITINAHWLWLRDEVFECLYVLYQCDFNLHATFSDNHQPNVTTFKTIIGVMQPKPRRFMYELSIQKDISLL